jgi:NADH-quinone oxidoreductase subunit C
MTAILSGQETANLITAQFPEAVIEFDNQAAIIKSEKLSAVADFLKTRHKTAFDYLTDITSTDYFDYFEVVYRLTSIAKNTMLTLKVRCYDRSNPTVPSVTHLWKGADFMEREIFDLMGISFSGHPNLKRIFLWEGYKGFPLRKDYL